MVAGYTAMPRMLGQLARRPEQGLLGARLAPIAGGPAVQDWRSFEDLDRFARDPAFLHLAAWRWFNRTVKASGDVGIWHETYLVRAGGYEAIARRGQSAARRVGATATDEVAVAAYPNP